MAYFRYAKLRKSNKSL